MYNYIHTNQETIMSKDKLVMTDTRKRIIRGMKVASVVQKISPRQAVLAAGRNQNQMTRFFTGSHDIMLDTIDVICTKGFGMSFEEIWALGGAASDD